MPRKGAVAKREVLPDPPLSTPEIGYTLDLLFDV